MLSRDLVDLQPQYFWGPGLDQKRSRKPARQEQYMTSDLGIVVAVDGSPSASDAIRWAARDAELRRTILTIVTACRPVMGTCAVNSGPSRRAWNGRSKPNTRSLDYAVAIAKEVTSGRLQVTTEPCRPHRFTR